MTDFVLARHGETTWHADNRYAGRTDVPLTPRGKTQADLLADWVATADLAATVSSPLTRARETLAPAASAAGLVPQVDEGLTELDFGDGEGHTAAEMAELFPDAYAAFLRDPVAHHLPGGEDPHAAIQRACIALERLTAEFPHHRVLVVWHSTLMRLVLCHLLGIEPRQYRRVFPFVRNAGLTEIRLTGHGCALLEFNSPLRVDPSQIHRPTPHPVEQ